MKKSFLALLVAAVAFAAAGTGGASTQSPQAAGRALLTCGKVHEEQLIPAPFAEHFGRELADIIRSGYDEHGRFLFLHP